MPLRPLRHLSTSPAVRRARLHESLSELAGVLRTPGLLPAALASLVARLPKGTIPLTLMLVARSESGSLAVAGLAAGLFALGDAVSAPLLGRSLDRLGRARTLLGCTLLHVLAVTGALICRGIPAAFCLTATVAGLALPPIGGAAKAAWAEMLPTERHHAGYTLESLLQQVIFLSGPLLVSALIGMSASAGTGLVVGIVLISSGMLWFVFSTRKLGRTLPPVTTRDPSAKPVLLTGSVLTMSLATAAQGIAFGAFGVSAVALSARSGVTAMAGVLQALLTVGGLLGIFTAGRPVGRQRFPAVLAGFGIVGLVLAASAATRLPLPVIGGVLVVQGVFLTPLAASSYRLVAADTPARTRAEAFGWLSTALAVGNACGASSGGWAAEHGGPTLGLLLGPLAVLATAVISRLWISRVRRPADT